MRQMPYFVLFYAKFCCVRRLSLEGQGCPCLYPANFLELDFSHLRAKGIDTLLAPLPQKRSSRCLYTPTDHDDTASGPFVVLF
jgi:hypothetical protein